MLFCASIPTLFTIYLIAFYTCFILNVQARNRPRPGALWRPISQFAFVRAHARYSIGHTFSMLTGHCVVLRLHAFSRSRDRSLKPRSTTMLVSTRAFNSELAKNTRGWRVVRIPKEDAWHTDIICGLYTSICEHDYDALEPFSPPSGSRDAPVRALIRRAQSAMDFQAFHSTFASRKCFCVRNFNN